MVAPVRPPDNAAAGKGTASSNVVGTGAADSAPAGRIGEYVEALASAVSFPATTQYGDAASISLTPGDWDVDIVGYAVANGATMVSFGVGISTTSGNSSTGLVAGNNSLALLTPSTAGGNTPFAIPRYRISLSATTTIYFKYVSSYSVATPTLNGRISARRAR